MTVRETYFWIASSSPLEKSNGIDRAMMESIPSPLTSYLHDPRIVGGADNIRWGIIEKVREPHERTTQWCNRKRDTEVVVV